ncbi:MAG TPA: hypothetical protein DCS64_01930 [Algoriphagus sp.]|uniref:hypothetical protein n=1 Tax=Algoriphagus sp. TaxID=1872435 RepID=UPI000E90F28A|nr:hypothetical protein [Algoriphagus sp.]HAS57259.1 hypothetical protein [Algoriphagus sp.]
MGKRLLFLILFLGILLQVSAQEVKVEGYFLQDSAKLGERIGYVLKASYPKEKQLIFPDSVYDFSPFVLLEKKTFISSTKESMTVDSAVYYLSNFELDPSLFLTLPVYELNRYDSVTHFPLEAELKLKLTLDSIPEQLVFQENNVYQPIEKKRNWLLFGGIALIAILGLGVFFWLFADRIKKIWNERNEKRRWKRFQKRWAAATQNLKNENSMNAADELLGLWKGYMESITNLPIKEWTSSEIGEKLEDIRIFSSLRSIEMIIYAGKTSEIQEASDYLLEVAQEKLHEKLSKIKHVRANH